MYSKSIPDDVPILPPPSVYFPEDGSGDGIEYAGLVGQRKKATETGIAPSRCLASEIPSKMRALFDDTDTRLLMLELFGLTSKVSQALGEAGSVPFINLLSAPTYLYHSSKKAYDRFKVMHDAIVTENAADALFWGAKGLDTGCSAVGTMSKTTSGVLQLAGVMEKAVVGLIFVFILPIILVVVGFIAGVSQMASLVRNAKTLQKFNEHTEKGDLGAIVSTLNYLRGPMQYVMREDEHADNTAKALFRLDRRNFRNAHFTDKTRFVAVQERIERLNLSEKIRSAPEKLKSIPGWENLFDLVRGVEGLYQNLLLSKYGDETKLVDDLIALYDKLEGTPLHHNEALLNMIRANKEELLSLKSEGHAVVELARSEIHRVLFYNALFILMAVMILTDGILSLSAPEHLFVANGLAIASCVLDIAYLIFDKKVSQEQFRELEKFLKIL